MKLLTGLAALVGLICSSSAQEYPIQFHRPISVNQQFLLSSQAREMHRSATTVGGKALQDTRQDITVDLLALVTVIEATEKGEMAKATYAITNCVRSQGGQKKQLFPSGTVVTGWLEGDEEQFTVNGTPVDKDSRRALALVAGLGKEQLLNDEVAGTDKPKSVDQSWDIKAESAVALLEKMKMGTGKQDIQGKTTLDEVVKVDGVECLALTTKIYLKKIAPPLPPGVEMKSSFGTIRLSAKLPTDLTMGPLEEVIEISADFTAQAKTPPNVPAPTVKGGSSVRRVAKMTYLKKP
jgi:hypothetical protein